MSARLKFAVHVTRPKIETSPCAEIRAVMDQKLSVYYLIITIKKI